MRRTTQTRPYSKPTPVGSSSGSRADGAQSNERALGRGRKSQNKICRDTALYLLGAPALVGLAHVGGRLNGWDELEGDVAETNDPDDAAGNDAQDIVVKQDGADKDVEDTTADEGEHEGGVARDLGRDLELKEADSQAEDDDVNTDNEGLEAKGEELRDATEDHDDAHAKVDEAEAVGEVHLDV
jgi:hypothetical protein